MQRYTFTLDEGVVTLLNELATKYYGSNKSLTIRAALESLAAHIGHEGWVIAGHTPVVLDTQAECHTCHRAHDKGDILYRPVFERGHSASALSALPTQIWLDCPTCVEKM